MDSKAAATAAKTALMVIDVQVAMFEEEEQPPFEGEQLLATIGGLIERARAAEAPVIFVRHEEPRFPPMSPGHPSFEVHPAVAPGEGEMVFNKLACDAFYGTPLAEILAERGIERLVVTGLQTDLCIDTFCRSALHRDFDVTLAADGHSTWDGPGITAAQIVAHHNRALRNVPHPRRSITVTPAAEIVFGG